MYQFHLCLLSILFFTLCTPVFMQRSTPILQQNNTLSRLAGFSVLGKLEWKNEELFDIVKIKAGVEINLRLYGTNLNKIKSISFTENSKNYLDSCNDERGYKAVKMKNITNDNTSAVLTVKFRTSASSGGVGKLTYFCINMEISPGNNKWVHLGNQTWLTILPYTEKRLMPLWLQICVIVILFMLSGLFSGLNLGLMALDIQELNIICRAGSEKEKRWAKKIRPIRQRGNFLLCTLLLGNVLVNNTLAILMDNLTGSGLIAIVLSTIGIVIMGEIIPQAICSRHGLAIGARTIYVTLLFMVITAPLSFPISVMLDKILGEEIGHVYDRAKLQELLRSQQLPEDEVKIIQGALAMDAKRVERFMKSLSEVYMLPDDAVLDFFKIDEIHKRGHTRIPIYHNNRANIVALLNVKDIALVDPENKPSVLSICDHYQRSFLKFCDTDTLDKCLKEFLNKDNKTHFAVVEHVVDTDDGHEGDPFRVCVGIITLEDIIEEIIQKEIIDETDENVLQMENNFEKKQLSLKDSGSVFTKELREAVYSCMEPQMQLACTQYLSVAWVDYFGKAIIPPAVLQELLKRGDIVLNHVYKHEAEERNRLYEKDKPANFAMMVLQGRVCMQVGQEDLAMEPGAFFVIGKRALDAVEECLSENNPTMSPREFLLQVRRRHRDHPFLPDFTVTAKPGTLQYLCLTQEMYAVTRLVALKFLQYKNSQGLDMRPEVIEKLFDDIVAEIPSEEETSNVTGPAAALTVALHRVTNSATGSRAGSTTDLDAIPTANASLHQPADQTTPLMNGEADVNSVHALC